MLKVNSILDLTGHYSPQRGKGTANKADKEDNAKVRRRPSHEPNRMLMRENKRFFSFAFDSAHVKCLSPLSNADFPLFLSVFHSKVSACLM